MRAPRGGIVGDILYRPVEGVPGMTTVKAGRVAFVRLRDNLTRYLFPQTPTPGVCPQPGINAAVRGNCRTPRFRDGPPLSWNEILR